MLLILFLVIYLYFLISAVITQIVNSIAALVASIGIPTQEAKGEIETHLVIAETKLKEF